MSPRLAAPLVLLALASSLLGAEENLHVSITTPEGLEPVFGAVAFTAVVDPPGEVARVEFLLNGETVAVLDRPPFAVSVDVGWENVGHRFEVRAVSRSGERAASLVETPPIRVDLELELELQQLYVTVTDGELRVPDLGRQEFEIVDDGARQEMVTFAGGEVPLAAVVLLDASASMAGRRLGLALRGAAALAGASRVDDEVAVHLFSDRLLYASPFVGAGTELPAALSEVHAGGGTALFDQLYLAVKQLESRQGRRVVIMLSDGLDSHSVLRMREVAWFVRRSRAMIYWLRLDAAEKQPDRFSSWKNADDYHRQWQLLADTVAETGGRVLDLKRIDEAEGAVGQILAELRDQYVLGYYPLSNRNDGSWHKVRVLVKRPGLRVRTRGGYLDY
jgi:Ca-activated chloride channel family protein